MRHLVTQVAGVFQPRRALATAALFGWLALALAWTTSLWRHQSTPGESAAAPAAWPETSQLTRDASRFTLVAFAHPACPCVRTTLQELRKIEAQFAARVQVIVVSCVPPEAARESYQALVENVARTTPRTELFLDRGEREVARFGAHTSGEVMLFRPDGRLAFHGGITAGRGHSGPNQGIEAVVQLLEGSDRESIAPVFGCPLGTIGEGR